MAARNFTGIGESWEQIMVVDIAMDAATSDDLAGSKPGESKVAAGV